MTRRYLIPVVAVLTIFLLLLIPPQAAAIGYLEMPVEEVDVEPGHIERILLTVMNPTGETRVFSLVASGPMAGYVTFNQTSFGIASGDAINIMMIISVPSDTEDEVGLVTVDLHDITAGGTVIDKSALLIRIETPAAAGSSDVMVGPLERNTWIFIIIATLLLCEFVGFFLWLYLRRQKYTEFRVRDVFLIHRDGRLVKHIVTQSASNLDLYSVSGMLTAIENFIGETFSEKGHSSKTGELVRGDVKILVQNGMWSYLAVVTSGADPPPRLRHAMGKTLSNIERLYAKQLKDWDGSQEGMLNIGAAMKPVIMVKGITRGEQLLYDVMITTREGLMGRRQVKITPERRMMAKQTAMRYVAEGVFTKASQEELEKFLVRLDDEAFHKFESLMEDVKGHLLEGKEEVILINEETTELIEDLT